MLTRRAFLRCAGLAGAGFVASGSWPALAAAPVTAYKGVTFLTPAYRALMYGIQGFVERLRQQSEGTFGVEFFDSASLMKADEQVAGLRVGTIQFMFHTTSYITETFPILGILGLPGVCQELYLHPERLTMESGLWDCINEALARDNLFMLSAGGGVMEPEYIWSGKNRVVSLADLAGKRCRVVSHEVFGMVEGFGAEPLRIPSDAIYLALQRGALDAVVANISTIVSRNLQEHLRYCYRLPMTAYAIALFLRKDFWSSLADKARAAFRDSAKWFDANEARMVNQTFYPDEDWPLVRKAGIETVEPSEDDLRSFGEKAGAVHEEWLQRVDPDLGKKALALALGKS